MNISSKTLTARETFFHSHASETDPELFGTFTRELRRQRGEVELIAWKIS